MKSVINNYVAIATVLCVFVSVTDAQKDVAIGEGVPPERNTPREVSKFPSGFTPKADKALMPIIPTVLGPSFDSSSDSEIFVSEYVSISEGDNIGTVFPSNLAMIGASSLKPSGGSPIFFRDVARPLLGTSFYTGGYLYDSVEFIDVSDLDQADRAAHPELFEGIEEDLSIKPIGNRVVNRNSLKPAEKTNGFTFNGHCTVVSDRVKPTPNQKESDDQQVFAEIDGQTCLYDMCFGVNIGCINLYSGTKYNFDIRSTQLPPAISAFVLGGTENYLGIKGTADIMTVTGRTPLPKNFDVTDVIGDATAFPGGDGDQIGPMPRQIGAISQKIFLITNMELPPVSSGNPIAL